MEIKGHGLYRAEHRGLRELHAASRQLFGHWDKLAERIDGRPATVLRRGAGAAVELLTELSEHTEERDLQVFPAAQGAGDRFAGLRNNAGDLLLERNQAMRAAVLDVQHLTTLLGYLGRLAATRGDEELAAFLRGWETRLRPIEDEARRAAVELGCDPASAVVPAEPGPLGRAGHQLAAAVGSAGEAIDNSPVGRAARRFARHCARGTLSPHAVAPAPVEMAGRLDLARAGEYVRPRTGFDIVESKSHLSF